MNTLMPIVAIVLLLIAIILWERFKRISIGFIIIGLFFLIPNPFATFMNTFLDAFINSFIDEFMDGWNRT